MGSPIKRHLSRVKTYPSQDNLLAYRCISLYNIVTIAVISYVSGVSIAAPVTHQDLGHFEEDPYRLRRSRKSSVPYRAQSVVTSLMVMNQPFVVHGMGSKNAVRTIIHEWEELPIKSCGFSNPFSGSASHSCKKFFMAERDLSLHNPVGGPRQFMGQSIVSHHSVRFQRFFCVVSFRIGIITF
jgi:hypothetical protein